MTQITFSMILLNKNIKIQVLFYFRTFNKADLSNLFLKNSKSIVTYFRLDLLK